MSTNIDWYQAQRGAIEATCRQLIAERVVEPLSSDEGETRRWNLWELASLVEGHFHQQLEVTRLSEEERLVQERRVTYDGGPLASPHGEYSHPFWLLADGRRVGTIAIATMIYGTSLISVSSLYVEPAMRRRNVARRALEAVLRAALASGAGGLRLDTDWTWQPAVRFYARIGMWVWMWKHDLVFTWQPELPPYRVEIGESQADFLIEQGEGWRSVVTARNLGDRLGWETHDLEREPLELSHCIPGTFALHLALAGWPLIRSEEAWERRYHWSDAGEPEGLAYKIEIFEAVSRRRGFEVRTPRIPGLKYRDYDDL
jgi:ribosomal protein S18 acetylase RimI-like enzyme